MSQLLANKATIICTAIGALGGLISQMVGGFDKGLTLLVALMIADYVTGLIVAAIFKKSYHCSSGGLSSKVGREGLSRKVVVLIFVVIGELIDNYFNTNMVRDAIIVGFAANELLSVVENAGMMGLPMPAVINNAVELLKKKSESKELGK